MRITFHPPEAPTIVTLDGARDHFNVAQDAMHALTAAGRAAALLNQPELAPQTTLERALMIACAPNQTDAGEYHAVFGLTDAALLLRAARYAADTRRQQVALAGREAGDSHIGRFEALAKALSPIDAFVQPTGELITIAQAQDAERVAAATLPI